MFLQFVVAQAITGFLSALLAFMILKLSQSGDFSEKHKEGVS
jgi:hypothetical protein